MEGGCKTEALRSRQDGDIVETKWDAVEGGKSGPGTFGSPCPESQGYGKSRLKWKHTGQRPVPCPFVPCRVGWREPFKESAAVAESRSCEPQTDSYELQVAGRGRGNSQAEERV